MELAQLGDPKSLHRIFGRAFDLMAIILGLTAASVLSHLSWSPLKKVEFGRILLLIIHVRPLVIILLVMRLFDNTRFYKSVWPWVPDDRPLNSRSALSWCRVPFAQLPAHHCLNNRVPAVAALPPTWSPAAFDQYSTIDNFAQFCWVKLCIVSV